MADETIDLNDPVVRELIDGAHADAMKLRGDARRLRTEAERDPERWRHTAHTRPGYATYPTTPPGNPSWWRHDAPSTGQQLADGLADIAPYIPPPVSDHDRCAKWCGFCHLGNGEPERLPTQSELLAAALQPREPGVCTSRQAWICTPADCPGCANDHCWVQDPDACRYGCDVQPRPAPIAPLRRRWWHRYTRRNP